MKRLFVILTFFSFLPFGIDAKPLSVVVVEEGEDSTYVQFEEVLPIDSIVAQPIDSIEEVPADIVNTLAIDSAIMQSLDSVGVVAMSTTVTTPEDTIFQSHGDTLSLLPPDSTILLATDTLAAQPVDSAKNEIAESEKAKKRKKIPSTRDHWTIGFKGGVTYFHLKEAQSSPQQGSTEGHFGFISDLSHQFSVYSEYNFDHGVGVGAYFGNYSYNRYSVLGSSIELGVYAHLSMIECFAWQNVPPIARRFHLFWDTGLGVSAMWQNNQIAGHASSDQVVWNPMAVVRTALQFEFMIRPKWGLFLEVEYHGYGRVAKPQDAGMYASPWINAGMLSAGFRYYFDDRKPAADPRLDDHDLPIREKKEVKPKNAIYVNVVLTPEMIEDASHNGSLATQSMDMNDNLATQDNQQHSNDIERALRVLEKQGVGTVLINSISFDEDDQLTDEAMEVLDKVAGSLLSNKLWTKVNLLYMSEVQAGPRASVVATYLRARGIKNMSVKGYNTKMSDATSDLIITIK